MDVTRGMGEWPVEDTLCVGLEAKFQQRSRIVVSNPVGLELMPVGMGRMRSALTNTSKEPFEGMIRLTGRDADQFQAGENAQKPAALESQLYSLKQNEGSASMWRVGAEVLDAAGTKVIELPARTFTRAVDLEGLRGKKVTGSISLAADGDKKVKSEQSLNVEELPDAIAGEMKGLAGLKLTYSFEAGWKFLRVTPAREEMKPIAGTPREMGMWLYGDGSGNLVRVRFSDSVGQVFQPNAVKIDFKGWRWVTIPLDGREAAHWGGEKAKADGTVHYPIRWDTLLLLDSAQKQKVSGEIWAAGVVVIE